MFKTVLIGSILLFTCSVWAQNCPTLFSGHSATESRRIIVRLSEVVLPQVQNPLLTPIDLKEIFGDLTQAKQMGAAALAHFYLRSDLSAEGRANLWIELAGEARKRNPMFFSFMFIAGDHRYIFRGGFGETLFIDHDARAYRTHTTALRDGQVWAIDYDQLRPFSQVSVDAHLK